MRRNEHVAARVLAATGLVGGIAYLAWRLVDSMRGEPLWLSVPFYAVELVGFVATALLAWALWPMQAGRRELAASADPVDVVVRVDEQSLHELRATLLALRSVDDLESVLVVDHAGRPEVASLAFEFQAVYVATDPDDRNGLRLIPAAARTSQVLLVDAGDVPSTDIVRRLAVDLADPAVAVVQGLGVSLADDSAEHGPDRRHELTFERSSLNPALGRRGVAVWLGSGSLVRVDALRDVPMGNDSPVEAHWSATAAMRRAGWRITAPADVPVLAHRAERNTHVVYRERAERVRAARVMLTGDDGVLRSTSYTAVQRLAAMAWAVRPLSSVRRVVFIAVLCGALLSGHVPFHATVATMAILWMPYFVYTSLALSLLSGWTLRPGDRARWSLHNIGATFSSLGTGPVPDPRDREPILSLPASQYGASLVGAVVAITVVLVLRGLSDQITHTMGELAQPALLAMVVVSLWLLALSLDALRVLGRRSQLRRATRVGAALSASFEERGVTMLDLTAYGAGVASHAGFEVGEAATLETAVPTRTGVTTVSVPAVVRNVAVLPTGEWRLGLEFLDVDDATANALAEYCLIEPVWEQMGVTPDTSITEARPLVPPSVPELAPGAGRMAMRLISLLALVGAVGSSLPARAEASALSPKWSGTVLLDSSARGVPGVVVTAVCDGGRRSTAVTDDAGGFTIDLSADDCRGYVAPPDGFAVANGTTAGRIALVRHGTGASASPGEADGAQVVAVTDDGFLIAEALAIGSGDEHLRTSLSVVVMALIALIATSLLAGLARPRRYAVA